MSSWTTYSIESAATAKKAIEIASFTQALPTTVPAWAS
jgi:hypothetical protein